jgi:glucose/arabinose dehydrogenase
MKFGPDGRLYVLEQNRGAVRIVQNDVLLSTPLITLPVQTGGSRGLLGIAFHPNFNQNGFIYLNYTTSAGGFVHNRVSRFTAVGNTANPSTEVVVWEGLDLEDKTMHYGGDINFGPDGKLYISTGDRLLGANGQNLNTTWGKMLRVNPDGTIPADNPFIAQTTGQNRAIWARGLRNPFKFTFQPGTGRMFIDDVGGDAWEEVNLGAPGANYGWSIHEGPSSEPGFTSPLFAYNHTTGDPTGCAVMGGDFYNPNVVQFPPEFVGTYIFPDHCQGWLKALDFENGNQLRDILTGLQTPVDVKVDPSTGALYYLVRTVNGVAGGGLFRIDYRASVPLQITQQPLSQTVAIGGVATFSVSAQGSPPLSYQWQRNGTNIPGATSPTYSLPNVQPSDSGSRFRVRVSNPGGSIFSNAATLTVSSNHVPMPTIVSPGAGTTYVAGQQMTTTGSATDTEDGTNLPASAFTWEVVFHHHADGTPSAHTHPFIDPVSGVKTLTFTIPNDNEVEADVFYRIHLTVTDSAGASTEVTRDVLPRTSQITLATSPPSLQLLLDDSPVTPPKTVTSVEGILRRIEAPSPQIVGGQTYVFQGWSDGGAALHTITTPTADTTYTATFAPAGGMGNALFVTGDPANRGSDQAVIDRLSQQLGFVVTVIDDDSVQASSAAGQDVVLISSSVSSFVANKLRDVAVPVIIWKPVLYDNMLMTNTVAGTDYGTISGVRVVNIQAIQHPLAPNGAETLTITTRNSTLPFGVPVASGDVVGRTGGRATLFTFSPGDMLRTGVPAPACRVAFPAYGNAISRYTAAGWNLFDRTVDWATSGCVGA